MTSFERIGGTVPVAAATLGGGRGDAGGTAKAAMATVGERVLAWSAQSFGSGPAAGEHWQARTGGGWTGFVPDRSELARHGDVYQLRELTASIGRQFGASPAAEGAMGHAVDDFARALALRFNALAGGAVAPMLDAVAGAVDSAAMSGPDGIEGVTTRIETAARMVEALNR